MHCKAHVHSGGKYLKVPCRVFDYYSVMDEYLIVVLLLRCLTLVDVEIPELSTEKRKNLKN